MYTIGKVILLLWSSVYLAIKLRKLKSSETTSPLQAAQTPLSIFLPKYPSSFSPVQLLIPILFLASQSLFLSEGFQNPCSIMTHISTTTVLMVVSQSAKDSLYCRANPPMPLDHSWDLPITLLRKP